ncbi:MAG: DNA-3-methyladenine glycosylase 2 family protein [Actinomycetota bacterium]|jgi:3-methyladenine DNA glycosylase/8-oxoguanine DNA glycosylase|nr:DNA-3-methyladenine glycosylase 2 family protein [Actinomycetota bacterium]
MALRTFTVGAPIDLRRTISFLAIGPRDPSIVTAPGEAWIATRTPEGSATLHLSGGGEIAAEAWGPGADWALENAPGTSGALDDPTEFRPTHPLVRRLAREHAGIRITRSARVVEMLLRVVVAQKVTGREAKRSYSLMARSLGEPAPGPRPLALPPDPASLASLGYAAFHPWGIERARAEVLIRVAARAKRMEEAVAMSPPDARARLTAVRGVGEWTAAKVALAALGDADAVPVGDYHLPNGVAWILAGEPRGDDRRMLELLEEFRPHRGRVVRLLQAAGITAPKYGARSPIRSIEGM